LEGQVVKIGKAGGAKMFKMKDSKAIGTNGSGIRGKGNGFLDH
jgi:hypothetical protein